MREQVRAIFEATIGRCVSAGLLPAAVEGRTFAVETPRNPAHGDYAVNAALVLAKPAGMQPRQLAQLLVDHLHDPDGIVTSVELAGPGFLNVRIHPSSFYRALRDVSEGRERFGHSNLGNGRRVMVEYVSANPTGPMHVGHGRGAVTGDAIARLLAATGHEVVREYYVNDAGGQVVALARSVWIRAREIWAAEHPEDGLEPMELGVDDYRGDYVVDVARTLLERTPEEERRALVHGPFERVREPLMRQAVQIVLDTMIRPDLRDFGIEFDNWFSERSLHESGAIEEALAELERRGFIEERVPPPPRGIERIPMPTSRGGRSSSSFPSASATTPIARSRRRTVPTPTSPRTSPTTGTSSCGASTCSSTSGAPTTAATSRGCAPPSRRWAGLRSPSTSSWCRW